MQPTDEAQEDAHDEIVRRHGTKVTLEQVIHTLVDLGWHPPDGAPRRNVRPPDPQEECPSCRATVNPTNAAVLCRNPPQHCPFRAARRRDF